jgi:preprotein translocase subunit YajC
VNIGQFLPFIVLIAAFYFLLIRPQRNRQRDMKSLMSRLRPGQQIMTTAGMFATVTSVEGDHVTLEIAPGVNVRYMAAAVAKVVQDDTAVSDGPTDSALGSGTSEADSGSLPAD